MMMLVNVAILVDQYYCYLYDLLSLVVPDQKDLHLHITIELSIPKKNYN